MAKTVEKEKSLILAFQLSLKGILDTLEKKYKKPKKQPRKNAKHETVFWGTLLVSAYATEWN